MSHPHGRQEDHFTPSLLLPLTLGLDLPHSLFFVLFGLPLLIEPDTAEEEWKLEDVRGKCWGEAGLDQSSTCQETAPARERG